MKTKEERRLRIDRQMTERREREANNVLYQIDQSKPGWSDNLTWQQILDARGRPKLNYKNL